jgi:hypothetical protein
VIAPMPGVCVRVLPVSATSSAISRALFFNVASQVRSSEISSVACW